MMQILQVKSIPILFWSATFPLTFRPRLISVMMLIFGLTLFGLGEAILIASKAGVSPWTVFAQGISLKLGISVGLSTFGISSAVLIFWWPLKQIPGLGTVLNIVIVAFVIDYAQPYLPQLNSASSQVAAAALGVLVTGFGGAVYLIANLGPGPRDGLMTGLQKITDCPLALVRNFIELSVVCVGWFLGGTVGIGTLLFAFGIGPCIAVSIQLLVRLFGQKKPK